MRLPIAFVLLGTAALGLSATSFVQEEKSEFTRSSIDFGVVVSDLDAAAKFYTEAIGFAEVDGFSVPAGFCTDAGLTDQHPLTIRVFCLKKGDDATNLKLMELPDVESKKSDNAFIHSQLGMSYMTIFVENTNKALERLAAQGAKTLAKSPVLIGTDPNGNYLTLVRDPDGNLIELIGPKK